jgi:HD domain
MPTLLTRPVVHTVHMQRDIAWARGLAQSLLQRQLPQRWAHSQGVAAQASSLRPLLGDDADLLVAAAWLHDIGYSPTLVRTGFHPIDGARYLRDQHHAGAELCDLVAHHTCATFEAEERGLLDELLTEFPPDPTVPTRELIYCDMTVGPDGARLTPQQRLSDIFARYDEGHVVSRAIGRASPCLIAAVGDVERRLASLGHRAGHGA